ncbi:Geraniol 8-hydroxylase [Camellia lanceoleosa]|uniref:Geraniol 8-hydroxylase n=1 Tax=Camellia lanceoleosa TaxID=1840588 RepID=A0ACC0FKH7_9ERIC|nr:Geraniol 8-hydroxylase [Camellia lanceoleosa]
MDLLSLLLCVLITWTLVQALISLAKPSKNSPGKLPPGPTPLPLIGNFLKLGDKPHKSLAELAKIYGPIMTIKLGQVNTVVISSPTMAKQILQKQDLSFSNRSIPDNIQAQNHDQFSVALMPISTQWRKLRKLCNSHVFVAQKLDANQHLRHQVVQGLIAEVRESCELGVAVDICKAAFRTTFNLLSNTIFSMELLDDRNKDTVRELKEAVWSSMEHIGTPNLSDYFPVLKKIDPQGIRRQTTSDFGRLIVVFDRLIDQRLELKKTQGCLSSNDVLDALLNSSGDDQSDSMDRTHIQHLLLDIFLAGAETTSSTMEWAMAEILHNPKTLFEARVELEKTIGKGKQVKESDITQLPYLQAIVKETFRRHPTVPLLVPRKVEVDVEVCGFTIPKGTQVLVNAWGIGRDPSTWESPNLFLPERFLGSQVDVRGQDFELIPFGAGRRICPGLPLAMRMLHLMLGSLINSFDWKLIDGISPEDMKMEEKFGLTLKKAQPLRVVPVYL